MAKHFQIAAATPLQIYHQLTDRYVRPFEWIGADDVLPVVSDASSSKKH